MRHGALGMNVASFLTKNEVLTKNNLADYITITSHMILYHLCVVGKWCFHFGKDINGLAKYLEIFFAHQHTLHRCLAFDVLASAQEVLQI